MSAPVRSLFFASFLLCAATALPAQTNSLFIGRWALALPGGGAGWLEIEKKNGWYDGSILWGGGSVKPLSDVIVDGDTLTVTRVQTEERKNSTGNVVRTQQRTETITATVSGNTLQLTRSVPRSDGRGFDRTEFIGQRIPALPPRPDLLRVKFGAPVALFNGRDLTGWRPIDPARRNDWRVTGGMLANRPPPRVDGRRPKVRSANLRTEHEFEDFRLSLEVNVPAGSNSGVYLRGVYEVQVVDSFGKPPDSHNMGAIYSRITPTATVEKPAGEWQSLDVTLVDRHVTVLLNGTTIIDNQPLVGCTGGALWSDELRPGPILLQGDHGAVSFRNLVLRPVVP